MQQVKNISKTDKHIHSHKKRYLEVISRFTRFKEFNGEKKTVQLTLVISKSMGPWKKFESTVVRLKRSYENTRSVVCLTTKGRQLERNFEELKPA
jgi:predicted transcriptional regulator